jgi:lipoprotein-releasing system permease protein
MPLKFETFLALRYLKSKRKEVFISIITIISVIGVAVSVMVLDIVMAVMTGFETQLQSKLIDASAHITIRRIGGDIEEGDLVAERIAKLDDVEQVYPFTYNQAMVSTNSGARGLLVRGVKKGTSPETKLADMLSDPASIESLFRPGKLDIERPDGTMDTVELPTLIIGRSLRDRLGVPRGSPVTLFAPKFSASPQGLVPKLRRFVVADYYRSGLVEYEAGLAYASIEEAQAFFGLGSAVSGIEIEVKNLFEAPVVAQKILNHLEGLSGRYYATDWTEQNKPLWDAIRLEKRVYFIVLLLLVLVASFSIVSTLVMLVMEKGKDIAILKSMGASDWSIQTIFLLQGSLIGFLGVILGTILGYGGCVGLREYGFKIDERVFSLSTVPVEIVPMNMLIVAIAGFIITATAGLYPAWRASRLRPADALRFE